MAAKDAHKLLELACADISTKAKIMEECQQVEFILQFPIRLELSSSSYKDYSVYFNLLNKMIKQQKSNVQLKIVHCCDSPCNNTCFNVSSISEFLFGYRICKQYIKIIANKNHRKQE